MRTILENRIVVWAAVTTGLLLISPAQGRSQVNVGVSVDWWEWIGDVRVHGSVRYRAPRHRPVYRDHGYVRPPFIVHERRPERRPRVRVRRGPAFCRSGAGHPVHGWRWCVRKGFVWSRRGYGPPRGKHRRRPVRCCTWHLYDVGPVYFHETPVRSAVGRTLGHDRLVRILGRGVVDGLYASAGYRRDVRLEGRWHRSSGEARVLQLRAGSTPLAELTDLDGDRRVDRIFLALTERRGR